MSELQVGDIIMPIAEAPVVGRINRVITEGTTVGSTESEALLVGSDTFVADQDLLFVIEHPDHRQIITGEDGDVMTPRHIRMWMIPAAEAVTPSQWVTNTLHEANALEGMAMQKMVAAGWRHRRAAVLRRGVTDIKSKLDIDTADLTLDPIPRWQGPIVYIVVSHDIFGRDIGTVEAVTLSSEHARRIAESKTTDTRACHTEHHIVIRDGSVPDLVIPIETSHP